jgi:hypothetical protein
MSVSQFTVIMESRSRLESSCSHLPRRCAVLGLLDPEDEGNTILRDIGNRIPVDTPRKFVRRGFNIFS